MRFDEERKRTPEEIYEALLACGDGEPCEKCCFYEAETPKGYSPCHEGVMLEQAAEYIQELIELKNKTALKSRMFLNALSADSIFIARHGAVLLCTVHGAERS